MSLTLPNTNARMGDVSTNWLMERHLAAGKTATNACQAVVVKQLRSGNSSHQACVQFPQTAVAVPADAKDQWKNARRCGDLKGLLYGTEIAM